MAGYIVHGEERNVVIPAAQADALVKSGSGDAALLARHAEVMHVRNLLDRLEAYLADVCGKDEE